MTLRISTTLLRLCLMFGLVVPVLVTELGAKDKDNDKPDRRGGGRNPAVQNPPKLGGNPPTINRNPGGGANNFGGGNLGGGNQTSRKIEVPRGNGNPGVRNLPNLQNPNNNPPNLNPQPRNLNPGAGLGQNLGNKGRDNDNKPRGGNNPPNLGGNNPNLGGQPNMRRRDTNPQPGGGNNLPNLGGNNPNLGGQPTLRRRDNDNKPGGGNNTPNLGGNNPNLGGQPTLRRRDNDNKPGGGNNLPNLGGNTPNVGGQPTLRRRDNDNKPSGGNNPPNLGGTIPGIGKPNGTPNPGGNPTNTPRNLPNNLNRNQDIKQSLKDFQPRAEKRQENERQLLRNKDQVQNLLNNNPKLKERIQTSDGKLDLSKLHLEHGGKDRIPAIIHKNGDLPLKLDQHPDLAERFHHRGQIKDLNDLNDRMNRFRDPDFLNQHPELKRVDFKHVSGNFQHQLVHNHNLYDPLFNSHVGKQLHLTQQFNLYQRGDVARQLNLNVALVNHGGWRNRYLGPIYSGYTANSFSSWYCGPGYYPKYCWSPTWSPWVDWCWWNTCPILYDPRPIYCRPIVYYDPCPAWVVYNYPVWQPLPVVACGTWVDLPTPVLVENIDLQLLAVRFVDNGHPDQNLGARYRMWVQNQSRAGIGGPFNVLLMASNTPDAVVDLPQAGVTIPSMEPGEMKVVDVRLPYAASKMNRVDNHLTPFNFLHVLVDSHQQLNDVNLANNGAVLPRTDILPVDPAAFAPDAAAAAPGAMVSIAGEGFGPEPGRLIVSVNGVQSEATVFGWYDLGVQFELPNVPVNGPTDAEVLVIRGDGAASNPVTVRIAPENKLEEAALPPAPLP